MKFQRLHILLAAGAALVAVLAWFAPAGEEEAGLAEPVTRAREGAAPAEDGPAPAVAQTARPAVSDAPVVDLFKGSSWYVPPPPPPPVAPPPPPPPMAPPLPFVYMGRYDDGARAVYLLTRGDRLVTVSDGEVIDGIYRVEGLQGRSLALTYLPLNQQQTLDTGVSQ